jgi:hypothetical protein
MVTIKDPFALAAASLTLGSIAAPLLYIASALLFPQGFADLRQASGQTLLYYFAIIWLASILLTGLIGGLTWRLLHRRNWDGFAAYALIGAAAALIIIIATGTELSNWLAMAMAACNGLIVRAVERSLR